MRKSLLGLCIFLGLGVLSVTEAGAADGATDGGAASTLPAASSSIKTTVYYSLPVSNQYFSEIPAGFENKDLNPPSVLGVSFLQQPQGPKGGFWLDFYVGAPSFTFKPLVGGGAGVLLSTAAGTMSLAGEIESTTLINEAPMEGSALKALRWGGSAKFTFQHLPLTPALELKMFFISDSTIAEFEGFPTKVRRDSAYILRPSVRTNLLMFEFEALLGIYSLGKAAIASKQFAWGIAEQTAFKPELAIGTRFGNLEFWVRGAKVIQDRDDTIEFIEQAPFYYRDNLVARSTLGAEVKWNF